MDKQGDQQSLFMPSEEEDNIFEVIPMLPGKKVYISPVLKHQAHLRDITLAPTTGIHESGVGDGRRANSSSPDFEGDSNSRGSGGIFENDIFGG